MLTIYRASAGSGKTYTLTKDYIKLLFQTQLTHKLPHRRTLAVTFTNKATDEMKTRILQELFKLSTGDNSDFRMFLSHEFSLTENEVNEKAHQILIGILHDYSGFSISTIDKFFQQVVRAFAREIGVSGSYNLELDSDYVLQQSLDNLYMSLSEKGNEQLLNWMSQFMEEKIEEGYSWNIRKDISELGKQIFAESYQHKADKTSKKLHDKEFLRDYRSKLKKIQSDFKEKIECEVNETLEMLERNNLEQEFFSRKLMHTTLQNIKNGKYEYSPTFATFADASSNCYTKTQKQHIKDAIDAAHENWLQTKIENIIKILTYDIIFYNTARLIYQNLNTLGIISDLALQIKKLTSEQNLMLISDTNLLLNKIIDGSDTPFVYERTGLNIDHFMIDEFQDTSTLQWQNFRPLISNSIGDNHFNMVVGDVKQSIYRWRNSDWKLLSEQINKDFNSSQINSENLGTNWRSDKNIITFNNLFFKHASEILQEQLNVKISTEGINNEEELQDLKSKITTAYGDTKQNFSPKANDGMVSVEFVEKETNKSEWQKEVMNRLPATLENLVDRGYKPSDIAFLVRNNKDAAMLTEFFLKYKTRPEARAGFSYDLMGREGLKLSVSRTISFIIAVLKLTATPHDIITRKTVELEYLIGKKKMKEHEALDLCFSKQDATNFVFSPFFSEFENEFINTIGHLPLYEATEKLISGFQLEQWYNETIFLQTFQDVVFKFSNSGTADLNNFLQWWDEQSDKLRVTIPENENAFKIMTIHASKGLDFKVVIIPFANWELSSPPLLEPLLWCETVVEPFGEVPLLPIKSGSALVKTIFKNDYIVELMHQYVDNLNLAYVAFTRARNEMICFAEKKNEKEGAKKSETSSPFKTISDLLIHILNNSQELAGKWREDATLFRYGEPSNVVYPQTKNTDNSQKISSYPVTNSSDRLKIKHIAADYWEDKHIATNRKKYGNIMHDILRDTIRKGDEVKALHAQLNSGRINQEDEKIIREELKNFWNLPEVDRWFAPWVEILNETSMLLPSGEHFRPDRIILHEGKATVIDYKFGEEEHAAHQKQVIRYMQLLQQMDFEVEGYLYYVSLKKILKLECE